MSPRRTFCLLSLAACVAGCGYSSSGQGASAGERPGAGYTWGTTFRKDVRTVAVPAFGTKSFQRGDEILLSQALVSAIESRTPYKVVPAERADTILEGVVVSAGAGTVSISPFNALPQESTYTMAVDFTWKDLRTGQILVTRKNFDQSATYYPTLGDGRFAGKQQVAEALAGSIVNELQGDW